MSGSRESSSTAGLPAVAMRGITKRFPGVVALDGVSLEVRRGEIHAICGENGAGKSTLMKVLSGVQQPDEGSLEIDGQAVRFTGTRDAERAGIAIIHQELALVEDLSVAANVFLGREWRTSLGLLDDRGMGEACRRLLDGLECRVSPAARTGSLRVGDQQLVEIAKALSLQASIVVMDEPTSALTDSESARLERTIRRLSAAGTTILYISHKMDEVFRLADRITVLRDGRHVRTVDRRDTTPRQITGWMVGRELADRDAGPPRRRGPAVLQVRGLTLPWPAHPRGYRLADVSLDLHAGEILGVAGLMGAGRTELLETIFGAGEPTWTGEIRLDGAPVRFRHPREACAARIAMVTEDRKRLGLFPDLDVAGNVSLCGLGEAVQGGLLSRRREEAIVAEPIRTTGVKTPGPHAAITGLSGGNQQKCIIGRWLLTRPRILLLDDPTRGIDVGAKAELYALIDRLCRDGLGVILTSSELPELLALADRIVVLAEGRLTAEFSRAEATEQRIMEAATGNATSRA
ncbi:MAG: sugar ABC transporter ATP-binding protein [Planctomycetia bacterium]|nr:sugar ABC transporter ATP-binding protein [Planctomycetia bacterium]